MSITILTILFIVQSNLYIADMLYNGHLVIADTFLRNWPNHGQTLIEKPLKSGHFYSGYLAQHHFFEHRVNLFGKIYVLIADTLWLVAKIVNTCFYLTHFFTLTSISLSYFSKLFFTHVHKKKVYRYLESQSNTLINSFSNHLYMILMICKLKKLILEVSLDLKVNESVYIA